MSFPVAFPSLLSISAAMYMYIRRDLGIDASFEVISSLLHSILLTMTSYEDTAVTFHALFQWQSLNATWNTTRCKAASFFPLVSVFCPKLFHIHMYFPLYVIRVHVHFQRFMYTCIIYMYTKDFSTSILFMPHVDTSFIRRTNNTCGVA